MAPVSFRSPLLLCLVAAWLGPVPAEEPAAESPPSHGRLDKNLVQDKE